MLTAVDFCMLAKLRPKLRRQPVEPLKMPHTKFLLVVLLVAGAHAWYPDFHFRAIREGCDYRAFWRRFGR